MAAIVGDSHASSHDFSVGNYRTKILNDHISAKNKDVEVYPAGMVIY